MKPAPCPVCAALDRAIRAAVAADRAAGAGTLPPVELNHRRRRPAA